jgi:2-polyprenyl-6-methoxyphenol hydroxylase-like FAD-dependent oxidoreductase
MHQGERPCGIRCVAVVGGAVAGAEVAGTLAERGIEVVVFEQNPRPFG